VGNPSEVKNIKTKSPASQAGLEQLPVGTLLAKHHYYSIVDQVRRLLRTSRAVRRTTESNRNG